MYVLPCPPAPNTFLIVDIGTIILISTLIVPISDYQDCVLGAGSWEGHTLSADIRMIVPISVYIELISDYQN